MGNPIHDGIRALSTTIRNVFRPVSTVQFPLVLRPRAERYRASFALLHDEQGDQLCIGCLFCERICPSQVISIRSGGKRESPVTGKKRGYADDFTLDMSACIFCELCVQVCPTDAIVMTREQDQPAFAREDLVLTMDKLYANEKSKTRSWGDGTKLMGMQDGPKAPKAHAAGHEGAKETKAKDSGDSAPTAPTAASASASAATSGSTSASASTPVSTAASASSDAAPTRAPKAEHGVGAPPSATETGPGAPPAPADGGTA